MFIKNDSGIGKTWLGQFVSDQSYYEIQSHELDQWANNSILITDIGNGDAIVSTDNTTNGNITDVNKAVNYLKNNLPTEVITTGIQSPNGLRARLKGIMNGTATKNTTTDFDFKMEQLTYLGNNKTAVFNGVEYYAKDAEIGDKMSFEVVDVDGVSYPAGTVLDQFGCDWYVAPDRLNTIMLYKAATMPNFYIRIKYTSVGTTTDVKFFCNLFRHMNE